MGGKKTGTLEWAESNVNIQIGCEHNCLYCYAKRILCDHYKKIGDWTQPAMSVKAVTKNYRKRKGWIMFPSSHDITPQNIDQCEGVLLKLLQSNNNVLIVTKPHASCVFRLCDSLLAYRESILWRFSIGSRVDDVLKFWEPGATGFSERFESLRFAHLEGFQTSISAEPFLDDMVDELFELCRPLVTDSFWIGKMNGIPKLEGAEAERYTVKVLENQTDRAIMALYNRLKDEPLIRWKDSIQEVIEREFPGKAAK